MTEDRTVLPLGQHSEIALMRSLTVADAAFTTLWVSVVAGWILITAPFGHAVFTVSILCAGGVIVTMLWRAAWLLTRALSLSGGPDVPPEVAGEVTATVRRGVRVLWGSAGVVLAAAILWNVLLFLTAEQELDGILLPVRWLVTLAVSTAIIALAAVAGRRATWFYLTAVQGARLALYFALPVQDSAEAFIALMQSFATSHVVVAAVHYMRDVAASVDRAVERSAREAIRTASQAAAAVEAARIDGLVHDHILAALLIASRADHAEDAPMVRRSAAGALAALAEIVAPLDDGAAEDGPDDRTARVPAGALARDLLDRVRELDPGIACSYVRSGRGSHAARGAQSGTTELSLPPADAGSVAAAALEAVRNSLRHADGGTGRPVRRRLRITATSDTLTVSVADDGVGFDLAGAPRGRYGVTGSIVGRMTNLEGGHAEVRTAPGRGTTVTLTLEPPPEVDDSEVPPLPRRTLLAEFRTTRTPNATIAWAAHIQGYRSGDVNVGSTVAATVGTAVVLTAMALVSLQWISPTWVGVSTIGVELVACALLARSWHRHPLTDIPLYGAIAFAAMGSGTLLATLLAWQGDVAVAAFLWTVAGAHLVPIVLGLSNYPILTWLSAICSAAVLGGWSLAHGAVGQFWASGWWILVGIPPLVNSIHRSSVRAIEPSAETNLRLRSRIDLLARPLLERLAAGERTIGSVRVEAQLLEARLRDDLRARCFRATDVTRAAHDARARGVHVELLDDGALTDASPDLRDRVITAAVQMLDTAPDGAVTIRVAPPGRDLTATVVARPVHGPATRLEIPSALSVDDAREVVAR